MSLPGENSASLITRMVLWCAVTVSVAVWLMRMASAVTIDRPFLGGTSGCEEEALFSVWKAARGFPVYNSPWAPPFSASYFGWLFYATYGLWSRCLLSVSGLGDAWLPTFCRFLTVGGLLSCIGIFGLLLRKGWRGPEDWPKFPLLLFSVLVFANPLFHWWSFTTRPDIWALVFELGALLAGFYYVSTARLLSLLMFAGCAFAAWSFRQTNISVLFGMGLWLLLARRWGHLVGLALVMAGAFAATFLLLGRNFVDSGFVANAMSGHMLLSVGLSNGASALTKDPLLMLGVVSLLPLALSGALWRAQGYARLAWLCAVISLLAAGGLSAKVGASANYYFPPAALLPLAVLVTLSSTRDWGAWRSAFVLLGAGSIAAASGMVLLGFSGNLRVPGDQRMHDLVALRSQLPVPVFCTDRGGNLPWILGSGADSTVFGFAYQPMLAAAAERFVGGTIASHLMEGGFATVVVARENASYLPSGGELAVYSLQKRIPGFDIYGRMP